MVIRKEQQLGPGIFTEHSCLIQLRICQTSQPSFLISISKQRTRLL
uniref:Uncharacterized protein n=1 Tax=Rhizophora mucronata TaxID=61149 RepID=A0A2P2PLS7_RHIMU